MDVRVLIAALPNLIFSVFLIAVTIWLHHVFSVTGNERVAALLDGLALLSFVAGIIIITGLHPRWVYVGGFRKGGGLVGSGPWGGILFITPLSITLAIVADHYSKKGRAKPIGPWHIYRVRFEIYLARHSRQSRVGRSGRHGNKHRR